MMYEFTKNFNIADSNELFSVRLISGFSTQKRLFQFSRRDVCGVHEKLSYRRFERAIVCYIHFGLPNQKTFDSNFLDVMYVEFLKNSHLADSNKLMAVNSFRHAEPKKRLISPF